MCPNLIVALDGMNLTRAILMIQAVKDLVYAVKIHALWDQVGPTVVKHLLNAGAPKVWVDLKLDDTPDTVAHRAAAVAEAGGAIVSAKATGGFAMLGAAVASGIEVVGITALTSLKNEELLFMHKMGRGELVVRLAEVCANAGVAGIQCSSKEVGMLSLIDDFGGIDLVVPGTRSIGQDTHDQMNVETPAAAVKAGATVLVLGRQVTKAEDPAQAIRDIMVEIASA